MKKGFCVVAILGLTLLTTGCAQKKINADDNGLLTDSVGVMDNGATNVDPFGGENGGAYGNNGGYNQNSPYMNGGSDGMQSIYFDVDKYAITPDMLPIVINNANQIQGRNVKIEGHCDASGSDEYNFALGLRRAQAAKDAMLSRGVNASNITIMSLGESAPECTTDFSSGCYAKNRRVEFKIIP